MELSPTMFQGYNKRNYTYITLTIIVVFGIKARIIKIKAFILL
jgi:hypothetical protein